MTQDQHDSTAAMECAKCRHTFTVDEFFDHDCSACSHVEHTLTFTGQRVGRVAEDQPWQSCSVGKAIHELLTPADGYDEDGSWLPL